MDTYDIPLTIICDLGKNTAAPQMISINQNEANIKKLRVEFVSGGKPWEIPSGFSCNILMKKADGFAVYNPAESISGNAAVFNITPQMTAAVGENYFQIQVVKSEDDARGFAAVLSVQKAVLADDDIISEDEKETINGLIDRAENAAESAESAADKANDAADRANEISGAIEGAIEGTLINDNTPSAVTAYSSNKIESMVQPKLNSILSGKKTIWFGDSVTWGESPTDGVKVEEPYPEYFGRIYGCEVINHGERGGTGSGTGTKSFCLNATNNATDITSAKYIFICYGINDFQNSIKIYPAADNSTFYGGMKNTIDYIYSLNPSATLTLIVPPQGKANLTKEYWDNDNSTVFDEYCNAIVELSAEYKTNLVDLRHLGINAENAEIYYPNSNNHLTQEGYNLIGQEVVSQFGNGYKDGKTEFYRRNYNVGTDSFNRYSEFENLLPIYTDVASYGGYYYDLVNGDNISIPIRLDTDRYYYFKSVFYYNGTTNVTVKLHDNTTGTDVETKNFVVSSYTDVSMNFYSVNGTFSTDHEYAVIVATSAAGVNCGPLTLTQNGIADYNKALPNTRISWTNVNFYVDGINGSDANPGTENKPFKTIDRFVEMYRYYAEIRLILIGDADSYNVNKCETLCNVGLHIINSSNNNNVTINFNGRYTPAFYNSHVNIGGTVDKYITLNLPNGLYFDGGFGLLANYTHFTGTSLGTNGCGAELLYCTFGCVLTSAVSNVYLRGCVFEGEFTTNLMTFLNSNVYLRTSFTLNSDLPESVYPLWLTGSRINIEVSLLGTHNAHRVAGQGSVIMCNDRHWGTWTSNGTNIINSVRLGESYNYLNG